MNNFKKYYTEKAGLTEEEYAELTRDIIVKQTDRGEQLLAQGEVCRHAFFVERGLLKSYTLDDQGKEHIIQFAPENWLISERGSLYFNERSQMFITSVEASEVYLIDQAFIEKGSALSPAFRVYHERLLQNYIRHLQKRVNLLLGATAEERYLDFIAMYPDLTLRVPQWMIASYLGITPEGLSRVRRELAQRNFKRS